ncbi:Uncharacterised protein [Burkholderia pseudomallei]|uniref:hypothetical protein n=1 Tax=Burkholderia pseudomallei TaxID=28450 RepID=UPI000F174F10|nr:hypothetical protein [Burkholderia pseudomallei]CAJ5237864.1 Uncharacterised protein [Burkholderia pseudomallei]CAJ6368103.1 Uncharacterised protein [Burkholderia pseudomallei]VBH31339.1 Uncharacterised protein [Burkholderia pseudomallei]
MMHQQTSVPEATGAQIGDEADQARPPDASGVVSPPVLDSPPVPSIDTRAEPQSNSNEVQSSERRDIEVIATAYDLHGREPRRVIDFDHASGRRVRRLLPERVFTSATRARTALIKAGVSLGGSSVASSALFDVVMKCPNAIGMYGIPYGWSHGQDDGPIYRFGDTVYSSSGPIPVYAEGLVPIGKQTDDLALLKEVGAAPRI